MFISVTLFSAFTDFILFAGEFYKSFSGIPHLYWKIISRLLGYFTGILQKNCREFSPKPAYNFSRKPHIKKKSDTNQTSFLKLFSWFFRHRKRNDFVCRSLQKQNVTSLFIHVVSRSVTAVFSSSYQPVVNSYSPAMSVFSPLGKITFAVVLAGITIL